MRGGQEGRLNIVRGERPRWTYRAREAFGPSLPYRHPRNIPVMTREGRRYPRTGMLQAGRGFSCLFIHSWDFVCVFSVSLIGISFLANTDWLTRNTFYTQ